MSAFVFLGAFKVNNMQGTSSINVGTQVLIGLESESTTKIGGSKIIGDANPVNAPVGIGLNTDINKTSDVLSPQVDVV
ncbi:MAG: hypothetical protein H0Z34_01460 [Brevibacillus sp.]|nr:hypothetical protein [Brevibacillus sp.]